MPMDDGSLIKACQQGDITAFECLVQRYQDRVLRVLYLLIGNTEDAQDVAQESFIRAYRYMRAFRGDCGFPTWLHRIAINTAHNWMRENYRRRAQTVALEDWKHDAGKDPADALLAKQSQMEMQSALASLPPHYREAVVLRHYDDLSYEEIAQVQQVPVGTVRSRLSKARMLLHKYLAGETRPTTRNEGSSDDELRERKKADPSRRGRRRS